MDLYFYREMPLLVPSIRASYGYDELVRAIDDLAYVIKNEIRVIPDGTGIGFLLDEYSEEGKIPEHIYLRSLGHEHPPSQPITVMIPQVNIIPRAITANLAPRNIEEIHPPSRPQSSRQCKLLKDEKEDRLV